MRKLSMIKIGWPVVTGLWQTTANFFEDEALRIGVARGLLNFFCIQAITFFRHDADKSIYGDTASNPVLNSSDILLWILFTASSSSVDSADLYTKRTEILLFSSGTGLPS